MDTEARDILADSSASRTHWWGVRLLRWVLALSDRQLVLALFVVALLPRLLLIAVIPHDDVNLGELNNVAVSFAEQGYLGNPYGFQTGPSAHIAPGYATIVGLLIRAVGSRHVGFLLDRILTAIVAALLVALLPVIARRLGLSRLAGLLASLALIIPFFTWLETSGDWEAPYTAIALAAGLSAAWPSVSGGRLDVRSGVVVGLVWGVALLFSPSLLPVLVAVHALGILRWRSRLRPYFAYATTAAVVTLLVLTPYLVRIQRELGGFAFIRSNLGLELAVSNNDHAKPTLNANLKAGAGMVTHPYLNEPEAMRVRAMGELAYNKARMAEAKAWIATHTGAFAKLTLRRVGLFWIPRSVRPYQTALFLIALVGAIAYLIRLAPRSPYEASMFAAVSVSYSAIYALVQTDPRYSFPLLWLHMLLCAQFVSRSKYFVGAEERPAERRMAIG
jgi:hypothetical protein